MIKPSKFLDFIIDAGVRNISGVPDSLLKELCLEISQCDRVNHFLAPSEGVAVAYATCSFLADSCVPVVYMQNSGLGNAINPLLSLAAREVSGIPLVLLIGWRGHPDVRDEPQHKKQGKIQEQLLAALEIPYQILDETVTDNGQEFVGWAYAKAQQISGPVALLFREGVFQRSEALRSSIDKPFVSDLAREEAIRIILENVSDTAKFVSTTGKISRELYALRKDRGESNKHDFYVVGAMGHASAVAFGFAAKSITNNVICLDGDGAFLMHLGSSAHIGNSRIKNFIHIVLNNGAHESVGGQPTIADCVSLSECARAFGYESVWGPITTRQDLESCLVQLATSQLSSPVFIEVRVTLGSSSGLPRPTETAFGQARTFMSAVTSQKVIKI